jgi:hypothetical protein
MRASRLVTLFAAAVIALLLLPSATLAATSTTTTAPTIKLGCAVVIPVPASAHPRIVCSWTGLDSVAVRAYRLWRSTDGNPRVLIAIVQPGQPLRHADPNVSGGHVYRYFVAAIGPTGNRVGASNVVTVRLARFPEVLRFNCFFKVDGVDGAIQGVECHWSAATRPTAVRYVLYRSVDGAARQAIYRTPLAGARSFLDRDVKAGQTIRYAVVALAADGRIVGVGGPDSVKIPEVTFTAAAG